MKTMTDQHGRKIEYLRLSVTDLCNYRCVYCMPEEGVIKKRHGDILSIEELSEIARAAHALGVRKIRLTGGEPLVRRGIIDLCRSIKAIDSAVELSITTNGSLLSSMAEDLKEAGVDRLNISLDTLDEDKFARITRTGRLDDVLKGITAAQRAGFQHIKLNTVLMGGINDDEIYDLISFTRDNPVGLRFIELMPMSVVSSWDRSRFLSTDTVKDYLDQNADITFDDGVAKVYSLPGHRGTVGLISPLSHRFCDRCNKIRVTADGKLKPCLHSETEIDLRGLHGEALVAAIERGISEKPLRHSLEDFTSHTTRNMNEIGG